MDTKSLHTLEFNKVLRRLAGYTSFSAGEALALALMPTTDVVEARRRQEATAEAVALFDRSSDATIGGARDVRRAADNAQRGATLPAEDFLAIRNTLVASRTLSRYLLRSADDYPRLAEIAELIEECPGLVDAISQTLDDKGVVLDSASERLARVRQELRTTHARIQEKLTRLLNGPQNQFLQEPIITMRAGRYVVPLRADARGRIRGIIHDQSGSGATLWIEPLTTVDLNNEYRRLQLDEQDEIQRILAALSGRVAAHGEPLKRVVERMAELDLIFACARLANANNGVAPQFVDWRRPPRPARHANVAAQAPLQRHPGSTIWIRGARHPLLDPGIVVPTDFLVDEETFLVLITGPNTGGKTVSLKNLGLMVLMAQAGLHLPAIEARLTVFGDVFADIGDEQSIEQNLSTFSGHITNIIRVLDLLDDRSLVLFDELGSGTDPAEGAAIAQAIVNFLRDKGATTFVATHYPELKIYASQTQGATNASLLFDEETLSPTYEMTIGLPGRSNALAIARRLGLDGTIIDDALSLVGQGNNRAETMLAEIYDMREKMVSDEAATRVAFREADVAREQLLDRLASIEAEREAVLREARAQAEAELAALRSEVQRMRREMRDAASLTRAKKVDQALSALEAEHLEPAPAAVPTDRRAAGGAAAGGAPRAGAAGGRGHGAGQDAQRQGPDPATWIARRPWLAVGRLQMRAALSDLSLRERAADAEPEEESIPQVGGRSLGGSPGMELDLRGKRVDEGLASLDRYLDSAFLANLPWVRIIHGKGTGRMREAVRLALKGRNQVASWAEGEDGEGGAGVTVVKFKED